MARINKQELLTALHTVSAETVMDYTRSIGILEKEYEKYIFHTEVRPLFSLCELRDPKDNLRKALKCARFALIQLNKEYFELTGHYVVGYVTTDAAWEEILMETF